MADEVLTGAAPVESPSLGGRRAIALRDAAWQNGLLPVRPWFTEHLSLRSLLAALALIWQRISRVGIDGDRPLFAGHDILETLRRLNQGREPLYAATAHRTVDVDDRDPAEIAAEILTHLA